MCDNNRQLADMGKSINELLKKNCNLIRWVATAIFLWICSYGIILLIKIYFFEIPERISLGNFLNLGIALGTIGAAIGAGFFAVKQIEINNKQTKIEIALRYKDHYVRFMSLMSKTLREFNKIFREVNIFIEQINKANGCIYGLQYDIPSPNEALIVGRPIKLSLENIKHIRENKINKYQIIKIEINGKFYFLGIEKANETDIEGLILEPKESEKYDSTIFRCNIKLNEALSTYSVDDMFDGWSDSIKESKLVEIMQSIEAMGVKTFWAYEFANEFSVLINEARLIFSPETSIFNKINEILRDLDEAILHLVVLKLKNFTYCLTIKEKTNDIKEHLNISKDILSKYSGYNRSWEEEIIELYKPHTKIITDFMV